MSVPKGTVFNRRAPHVPTVDLRQIPRNAAELDDYIQVLPRVKNRDLFSLLVNLIRFQQQVREREIRNPTRIQTADDWYEALKIEVRNRA